MPVDPSKPRKILVVHGVQLSDNASQNQHEQIRDLVRDRLNGLPLQFETDIYRYEDINDAQYQKWKDVLTLFTDRLVNQQVLGALVDIVGDVVINLDDGATAAAIRKGLRDKIEQIYDDGNPLYVVAHSLGSIYAFDVINELIKQPEYFDRDHRTTWPVQGLVTIGSPLGLAMFNRNHIEDLGAGRKFFRWNNYWDRTDPVISGSFYGKPEQGYFIAEHFATNAATSGWLIRDRVIDVGRAWLMAHVGYWTHPVVGDDLVAMITS